MFPSVIAAWEIVVSLVFEMMYTLNNPYARIILLKSQQILRKNGFGNLEYTKSVIKKVNESDNV